MKEAYTLRHPPAASEAPTHVDTQTGSVGRDLMEVDVSEARACRLCALRAAVPEKRVAAKRTITGAAAEARTLLALLSQRETPRLTGCKRLPRPLWLLVPPKPSVSRESQEAGKERR